MARRGARGYVLPEKLPLGREITSGVGTSARRWRLGASVGTGGFGEIYSAAEVGKSSKDTLPYVVKIEPHGNGPLFVEMHFYMRNAKKEDVEAFMKAHSLKILGMPIYIASGSHEFNDVKYRFVVMERYGKDLWHRFLESGRLFPTHTVFRIALQMLDVYEYIHSRMYVHADLKGANILFGLKKGTENQAYLVDFGLASHFTVKEFKRDPKKAHNGTIEYTSRDAHNGVPTRRGDMEILGYNIVQWLTGLLPWESDLRSPVKVQAQKEKYMEDIPGFLRKTFVKTAAPSAVSSYLQYVSKMEYDEAPDYKACRQMFESGLKSLGFSLNCNLDFTPVKLGAKQKHKIANVPIESSDDEICIDKPVKAVNISKRRKLTPKDPEENPEKTVKKKNGVTKTIKKGKPKRGTSKKSDISSSSDLKTDSNTTLESERSLRSNASLKNINDTVSSVDIFEDSCIATPPKTGLKRKHTKKFEVEYCTDEEITVRTTVKKKGGLVKEETRSWKKCPTILNGRTINGAKNTG